MERRVYRGQEKNTSQSERGRRGLSEKEQADPGSDLKKCRWFLSRLSLNHHPRVQLVCVLFTTRTISPPPRTTWNQNTATRGHPQNQHTLSWSVWVPLVLQASYFSGTAAVPQTPHYSECDYTNCSGDVLGCVCFLFGFVLAQLIKKKNRKKSPDQEQQLRLPAASLWTSGSA